MLDDVAAIAYRSAMTRTQRALSGAKWGAVVSGTYFAANLAGAFLAIGWLFFPNGDSVLLLLPPAVVVVCVGACAGAVFGLVWPRRWRLPSHVVATGLIVVALVVGITGYSMRVGRNLEPPASRPPVAAENARPVLWVMIDTLRADTLYGDDLDFPLTPGLREYARSAWVFSDAEATAGWTVPSLATIFTGIHNTTMDASAGYLPSWAPTVAERLHAAGYATCAIVDNALVEPRNGFAAGFETYFQRSSYRFAFSLPAFRMLPVAWREGLRAALPTSYLGAPGVTDAALEVLGREHDAPLFLYVQYMDPHGPYHPHAELSPDPPEAEPITFWRVRDRLHDDTSNPPTEGQMLLLRHRYANEVRWLDPHLTRLLEEWHRRYGNEGLVVIMADHGEEFLEHGHLAHSMTVHRELTHVPLVIRFPAGTLAESSGRINRPVSLMDLLPTTLDVLGVDATLTFDGPPIQGTSWLSWLDGSAEPPTKPLIASHSRHGRRTYRYREGPWVYVKTMFYDKRPTERGLFDVRQDPFEQHSVLAEHHELFAPMSDRFETLARSLWQSFDPEAPNTNEASEESLRALGYIQ